MEPSLAAKCNGVHRPLLLLFSISAVLSLAIAVIHFRMPCWEAETKDPEWFY